MEKQFKQFTAEKQGDFWAIASDETPDRAGDIVKADGWDLENYKKNPVLLWAHDYSKPPVGRALDIQVSGGKLIFRPEFASTQMGQEIKQLYEQGYLKTFSVGFIPKEYTINPDTGGYIYTKSELLEISCVPVPANPNALALLSAKGLLEGGDTVTTKGAVPYEETPKAPEDRPWDGPAAEQRVRKWASSDGSGDKDKIDWSKYAKAFLFVDSSDKENFGSYYFIHHDIVDGKFVVVWSGVRAAMAYLLKSYDREPVWASAKKAMYNHLVKHYKQFDKEPPEYKSVEEILFEVAAGKLIPQKNVILNSIDDIIEAYVDGKLVKTDKTVTKEGRVLSSANVEKLTRALNKIKEAASEIEQLVESAVGTLDENGGKSMSEQEIREKLEQEYKEKLDSEVTKLKEEFKTALDEAIKAYKEKFVKSLKGDEE